MISSAIIPQPLARLPWKLIFLVFGICLVGLTTLYSAAGGSASPWALRQGVTIVFFFCVALAVSWIPENTIKQLTFPAYAAILILLIIVEAVGFVGKGAQRWVDLGFIRLQPSEFMKPAIVLTLARFYDLLPAGDVRRWRGLWPAALLVLVPWALILVQPDLGTATMVLLSGVTVMFLAGLPMWYFMSAAGAVAVAMPILYSMMHDYQRKRVLIFLDPESDPLGSGYHLAQSKIAIGSGGIAGKGYLNGSQSHLDYLPEGHTDFVFAAMVEEWGLIGGTVLILAFLMVVRWGMQVSKRSPTRFGQLTAAGLSTTIFFYFSVNLLMVMGLAPVVGIPLPLVSYGGSAVMTVMLCLGVLMGLERQQRTKSRLS
ncbi:rod shape-determining protein RodA [Sphingomonas rhizophila]|uniref:Peptidoglycan glycosyltransferase MrdB n=1 Tax=Sphingomonas rhizophila TaxID=2071607 RepID=A0A7G9SD14_9SPHN|nr:rod shape-determining protein RodA [Sphingomonas rhizophila]QNN65739.1 rod shape-determining protein RodA [Sphingomonas rhizophila]